MPAELNPLVVDLSHHNVVTSFPKVYQSGIRGVIHKATQGTKYVDSRFIQRAAAARKAGLLWGAYHFATDEDVEAQVDHFLAMVERAVGPDRMGETLLALDWEPNTTPGAGTMTLDQAKLFLEQVAQRTGQMPVLYSGHLLKEKIGRKGDPFLAGHRLWLAQYAAKPVLPAGFSRYFLWQFTGDGTGPGPHSIPGIEATGIDLNHYAGTPEDLASEWAPGAAPPKRDNPVVAAAPTSVATAAETAQPEPDKKPDTRPGAVATAVRSKSLWAILVAGAFKAVESLTTWLTSLWDLILWAVGALPDVAGEVKTTLTTSEEVTGWFKIDWAAVSVAVAGAVLLIVFIRHLADKRALEAAQAPAQPAQS